MSPNISYLIDDEKNLLRVKDRGFVVADEAIGELKKIYRLLEEHDLNMVLVDLEEAGLELPLETHDYVAEEVEVYASRDKKIAVVLKNGSKRTAELKEMERVYRKHSINIKFFFDNPSALKWVLV